MRQARLGNVCEINPPTDKSIGDEADCSFVPMEYIDEYFGAIAQTEIRRVGEVKQGYTFFRDGDVIFAKITPCMENGKCAVARNLTNGIGFGSTEFHVLRAGADITPEWIYYFLRQEQIRQSAVRWFRGTAGQQRVPSDFLDEIKILLPPLSEQRRLATILDKADRLRRLRRYALELSGTYLQSVFLEMFGGRKRYPSVELENLLSDDPKNGLYLPAEKYGNGTPIIRITEFYDGVLADPKQFKRVEASQKEIGDFAVTNGEILINRVNSLEYLGKCALVQGISEPTLFESNMMRVRVDTTRISPVYLVTYLSSQHAHAQILQMARKAVNQASINQGDVKSLIVPLPPIDLQAKFARAMQKFERLRAQQREAARQAEHLFQMLLHRAFAGEV